MTRIQEIERRLAAATPDPWHYDGMHDEITSEVKGKYWLVMSECRSAPNEAPIDEFGHQFSPDFELIADAPAALRWLLDQNRDLRAALQELVEWAEPLCVDARAAGAHLRTCPVERGRAAVAESEL